MSRFTRILVAALALTCAAPVAGAAEDTPAQDEEFSEANQLLFLDNDQITGADRTLVYHYALDKHTTMEDESDFHDEIAMTARPTGEDGAKAVSFDYMSGERGKFVRKVDQARGNPVIMVFLQRDVSEMERLTDGHWRYFQKRIKLGLEEDAEVQPATVTFDGREVEAKRITLRPFTEERRDSMQTYTDKVYQFTLSESVPGKVYEMRTLVPGDGENAEPLIEERLVLDSVRPVDEAPADP